MLLRSINPLPLLDNLWRKILFKLLFDAMHESFLINPRPHRSYFFIWKVYEVLNRDDLISLQKI